MTTAEVEMMTPENASEDVPRTKWSRSRFVGATTMLVGLGVITEAFSLSIGSGTEPGPGMWPLVIGAVLVAASVVALSQRVEATEEEEFTASSLMIVPALLSLFVFIWAFSVFGFVVSGFALAMFWLKVLGRGGWLASVVIAAVATAAFSFLFVSVLGVPFPDDVIRFWR